MGQDLVGELDRELSDTVFTFTASGGSSGAVSAAWLMRTGLWTCTGAVGTI